MEELTKTIVAIIRFSRGFIPDDKLADELENKFPDYTFGYQNCVIIDHLLGDGHGPFFRGAYGYPSVGDSVSIPLIDGTVDTFKVTSSGFYTFDVEE